MYRIKEYYPYLCDDLSDVTVYLFPGIVTGVLCGLFVLIGYRMITHTWRWKKPAVYALFIAYLAVVFQIAYFSRQPGSRTDVAFGLGDTWGTTIQAHAYVIENVMMFIPFGILFPMLGKAAGYFCMPVAICFSVALEGIQYVSQRGYCQLDDVVANVTGACIGYGIYLLVYVMIRAVGKQKAKHD